MILYFTPILAFSRLTVTTVDIMIVLTRVLIVNLVTVNDFKKYWEAFPSGPSNYKSPTGDRPRFF